MCELKLVCIFLHFKRLDGLSGELNYAGFKKVDLCFLKEVCFINLMEIEQRGCVDLLHHVTKT